MSLKMDIIKVSFNSGILHVFEYAWLTDMGMVTASQLVLDAGRGVSYCRNGQQK